MTPINGRNARLVRNPTAAERMCQIITPGSVAQLRTVMLGHIEERTAVSVAFLLHGVQPMRFRVRHRGIGLCAGSLRPHAHKGLAAALGDQLVVMVVGAVMKLDDTGAGARF